MGNLFIVATPIGNLDDMTFRAIETLKTADVIACEDTRHSIKLLNRFEIKKPLISYHAADEEKGIKKILALLEEGETVAYISDAGTPGMSDPGGMLVRKCRAAGHEIIPIPGVSAFTALVSVSGAAGRSITFEGFLSPKKGKRRTRLQQLLERNESFVVYESPYRVLKLLEDLKDLAPGRQIVVGRELTKKFEEIVAGTSIEIVDFFSGRSKILGEFSILVAENKI